MPNKLVIRDQVHNALYQSLHEGESGLKLVPKLIKRAILEEVWKERLVHQTNKEIPPFPSFLEYVEARPPNGLGATSNLIERLICDDEDAHVAFRKLTTGKPGRRWKITNSDNVTNKPDRGNSRAYTLDRLKRERPDLFDKVKAGKLTANAAAIEAGFRKPPPTKIEQALKLLPGLTRSQLRHVRARIDELLRDEQKGKRAA